MSSGSSKSGGKRATSASSPGGRGVSAKNSGSFFTSSGQTVTAQQVRQQQQQKQSTPAATQPAAQQPQAQPQTPVAPPPPRQRQTMTAAQFAAMTDSQKAAAVATSIAKGVPAHLADNSFQRFLFNNGLNDTPDVVSEAQLKKIKGQEVYRTVNAVYSKAIDVNYSAPDIGKQVLGGKATRVSDTGGSMYGRGLYFATTRRASTAYGDYTGDLQKTAVIHAKLNSNAKIISYNQAYKGVVSEINRGTKLGQALAKCDSRSQTSIYAIANGYNVISDGRNNYMNVLDRSALTCSNKFTAK